MLFRSELEREGMNINKLWLRRQTTKFNGVPYVVQRAAAAVFTESGMAEIQQNLDYYRKNAKVIADALDECGVWYCGGMMDCKKALTAADGDIDKAVEWLREKGLAAAQKKAGRIAAEGMGITSQDR